MKIYYHLKPRRSGLTTKMVEKCSKFEGNFLYVGRTMSEVREYQKLYQKLTGCSWKPKGFKSIDEEIRGYDRFDLMVYDECDFNNDTYVHICLHGLNRNGEAHVIHSPSEKLPYNKSDIELVRKMKTIYGYDPFKRSKFYAEDVAQCVNSIIYTDLYKPYKESFLSTSVSYSHRLFNDWVTEPIVEIVDGYKTLIENFEEYEKDLGERVYDLQILGNFWE